MALKVGNTTIKKVNVVKDGKTTALKKLYVGDVLVWKAEQQMSLSVALSGGPSAITGTTSVLSDKYWDLSDFDVLTYSTTSNGTVSWWQEPKGELYSTTLNVFLVFGDTSVQISSNTTNGTLDISKYANRSKVYLKYEFGWNISSVTNSNFENCSSSISAIASLK